MTLTFATQKVTEIVLRKKRSEQELNAKARERGGRTLKSEDNSKRPSNCIWNTKMKRQVPPPACLIQILHATQRSFLVRFSLLRLNSITHLSNWNSGKESQESGGWTSNAASKSTEYRDQKISEWSA